METSIKNENQKNNNLDSYIYPKRQNSFKHLIFGSNMKKTALLKYLLNKNENILNNRKATSKEKNSTLYIKSKNLPSINLNTITNTNKKPLETYSFYNNINDVPQLELNEKENIISQLLKEKTEFDIKNKELIELKKTYKNLQDKNLTYKLIIEKILNIESEIGDNDIYNENEIYKDIKNINKNKKSSIGEKKIIDLKKQIINYNKAIEEKDKLINESKKEKSTINFMNINKLINEKNFELENLILDGKQLQYYHNDMDKKYDFINYSIKKFKININDLKYQLKKNNQDIKYNESIIESYLKEKEEINKKIEKLEKDVRRIEEDKIKNKNIIKELNIDLKDKKDINKEKEDIYNKIEYYNKQEKIIKNITEKNNNKIILLQKENNELKNDILIKDIENKNLSENIKQNLKNRQNVKIYEKEIKQLKEEIEKNKILKIKQDEENKRINKEIEEFEKAKIGLINKINELNKELNLKIQLNIVKEKELNLTNKEYVDVTEKKNHK